MARKPRKDANLDADPDVYLDTDPDTDTDADPDTDQGLDIDADGERDTDESGGRDEDVAAGGIIKSVKDMSLVICPSCGRVKIGNRIDYKLKSLQTFRLIVQKAIRFNDNYPDAGFRIRNFPGFLEGLGKKKSFDLEVEASATVDGKKIKELYTFPARIQKDQCRNCQREKSHYFEAILQVRNRANEKYEEIVSEILDNCFQAKAKGVFITKTHQDKDGVDLYLTSVKFARSLTEQISGKYGAITKSSPKLFSMDRQTSKKLFRTTFLIRLPDISTGDVIRIEEGGKLCLVTGFRSDMIILRNVMNAKRIDLKMDAEYKKIAGKDDIFSAMISKRSPMVEVIHPKTYQSVAVENLKQAPEGADELKVFMHDGIVYAI